ncbi:RDD family protein [Nitratireductor aquimarinus]|uniref:RDD family protein n=1 Tax=Nitratireductor aquimarinus TaxID=889300 RepID=A0ABU4AJ16_9HYPH|nr:RDD family protein [Nitratireductor aquimarinus]MDV6226223.1 RDD family protein [Nitratireductor aquimarinus]
MTNTFDLTPQLTAPPGDRQPDFIVRQGTWLHVRRFLAFLLDYALYLMLAVAFSVLATLLMKYVILNWLSPDGPLAEIPTALHTLAKGAAGLATLAAVILYIRATLGGRYQATFGMRLFHLRLERLDTVEITPRYATAHTLLAVATCALFTPLILLAAFFLSHRQTVHDRLLDTVMVRTD